MMHLWKKKQHLTLQITFGVPQGSIFGLLLFPIKKTIDYSKEQSKIKETLEYSPIKLMNF